MAEPKKRRPRRVPPRGKPITYFAGGHTFIVCFTKGRVSGSEKPAGAAIRRWVDEQSLPFSERDARRMEGKVRGAAENERMNEEN